jgi:hypothetical protein
MSISSEEAIPLTAEQIKKRTVSQNLFTSHLPDEKDSFLSEENLFSSQQAPSERIGSILRILFFSLFPRILLESQ